MTPMKRQKWLIVFGLTVAAIVGVISVADQRSCGREAVERLLWPAGGSGQRDDETRSCYSDRYARREAYTGNEHYRDKEIHAHSQARR